MTDLYETTIQQIRDSGLAIPQIAKGAKVGNRWLYDLMSGRFSDPGVKKIQRLNRFLTEQQKQAA